MNSILARLMALAALLQGAAGAETALSPEYLEGLRAAVRAEHPSVAAAQARMRAAEAAVRAVRLWEDPMVGLGVMGAEKDMRMNDGDVMLSVEQVIPRRKLFEAEKAKMRAERSMAEAESRSTVVKLERLAVQTAIELALADEMVGIDRAQVEWLEKMDAIARERLKDPMSSASEPLRIRSEWARERQRLDSNLLMRQRLARQLNILLGRPADDPWEELKLPAAGTVAPALEAELAKIASSNPILQAVRSAEEAARAGVEVAERERKPMFSVGIDNRVYSGGDFRSTTVGAKMTIPLFNRSLYRAKVEQARAEREAAEKEALALERELRSEMVMAYTDAENAGREAATFAKEVIPAAEKAAESTHNAWITQRANLLEALEARRASLSARLEERRFIAAQAAAIETLRAIAPPKTEP